MATKTADHRDLTDVVADFRFAQLVTQHGGTLSARPLTVLDLEGNTLRFLVSDEADWVDDAQQGDVLVTLSDPKHDTWASITGRARVNHDKAAIEKAWSAGAAAYFDGKDDPHLRLLEVDATAGEFWDGPSGKVGQAIGLAKVAVTGTPPGEKGTIDVR